ncbi:hypothetical protein OKW41_006477 [Paraburkholderia sp. UCT70]
MDRDACGDHDRLQQSPELFDPVVIIDGFMSHFRFTVPLALIVKRMLALHPAS